MTYAMAPADPTSVVGLRVVAYGIDLCLTIALTMLLMYPLFMSSSRTAPLGGDITCSSSSTAFSSDFESRDASSPNFCFDLGDEIRYIPVERETGFTRSFYGIWALISALDLVLIQGLTGGSIGKLIVGLRVIREDGKKATIGWAALRWVLLLIDALCCFLPGAILVFTTKGHRRLGDMAASTFVVSRRSVGTPPLVPGVTAPADSQGVPGWSSYPSPAVTTDGPIWDQARDTYIQFDRSQNAWVQWDETTREWRPIV